MASIERIRLAQEIHDGIAQDLIGIGYALDLILGTPEVTSDTRTQLRTLRFSVTDLIDKVRREMYQLREPLGSTLAQEIVALSESFAAEFQIERTIETQPLNIEHDYEYEILRIVGELLQNVSRHSGATRVSLTLSQSADAVDVRVADNGIGIESTEVFALGLAGVRERAHNMGAHFEITATRAGTEAHLTIPVSVTKGLNA